MINLYKSNEGFSTSTFIGKNIPQECIQVDNEKYQALLDHKLMWQNGELVDNPNYETYILEQEKLNQRKSIIDKIAEFKQLLASSDYKAIKYAEGVLTKTEYAETKALRQSYRDEINELESQLAKL